MILETSLVGITDSQNPEHVIFARWQGRRDLHDLMLRTPGYEAHAEGDYLTAVLSEPHLSFVIAASAPNDAELPTLHAALAWLRGAEDRCLVYAAEGS